MIKLYIYCLVLIIGSVEVGPDIDMKFQQEVIEIVSYDIIYTIQKHENLLFVVSTCSGFGSIQKLFQWGV